MIKYLSYISFSNGLVWYKQLYLWNLLFWLSVIFNLKPYRQKKKKKDKKKRSRREKTWQIFYLILRPFFNLTVASFQEPCFMWWEFFQARNSTANSNSSKVHLLHKNETAFAKNLQVNQEFQITKISYLAFCQSPAFPASFACDSDFSKNVSYLQSTYF